MEKSKEKKITCVFLDRDGVVNQDSKDYIKSPEEFFFIPQSIDGIKLLNQNNIDIILITNQSVIRRNLVSQNGLKEIFHFMQNSLRKEKAYIKDIFFCPHIPDDNCSCRKPKTGLIKKAVEKYKIDLNFACMIGDSSKDIKCASNAGCAYSSLVLTGNGLKAKDELEKEGICPSYIAKNLYDAAKWVINL